MIRRRDRSERMKGWKEAGHREEILIFRYTVVSLMPDAMLIPCSPQIGSSLLCLVWL